MEWRFQEIMSSREITQEKMAEMLGCSVGQVNMLLSGKRKFHNHWISRIAHALDIPAWHLFVDPELLHTDSVPEWLKKYIPVINEMNPEQLKILTSQLDTIETIIKERKNLDDNEQKAKN